MTVFGHRVNRKELTGPHTPIACSTHIHTTTMTKTFNIVRILPAIGMYLFTSESNTPTTIKITTI